MVKKYHIVTSVAEKIFKFGFQNISSEEEKALNASLAKKNSLQGKIVVCKSEEKKASLEAELQALEEQLSKMDAAAIKKDVFDKRLAKRNEIVAGLQEASEKETNALAAKNISVDDNFNVLDANGQKISVNTGIKEVKNCLISYTICGVLMGVVGFISATNIGTVQISLNSIDKVKSFVNDITKFDYDFDLVSGRYVIDAKSIMGIFSLDLSKPIDLNIHAEDNAEDVLAVIKPYMI